MGTIHPQTHTRNGNASSNDKNRRGDSELTIPRRRLATNRNEPVVCALCGRSVERAARQQRYCSARCREKGKERTRKAGLTHDTGAPPDPPKNASRNNNLRRAKSGSNHLKIHARGWQAPGHVIRAHFPAGVEVVSRDGVASFVVQLRPRGLVR